MEENTLNLPKLYQVLEEYAAAVMNTYKQNLTTDKNISSGALLQSLTWQIDSNDKGYIVSLNLAEYWKYQEYGVQGMDSKLNQNHTSVHSYARNRKYPPISAIRNWIQVKPIIPRAYKGKLPTINQLAFLISRSIGNKGLKAHNNLGNAVDQVNATYKAKIIQAFNQDIHDNMGILLKDLF